jgi:type I restriction enzyme S subunit
MGIESFTLGDLCIIEKGATGILKAIPGVYPLVVTGEDRKSHNEFQFDDEAVIIPLVSGTGHGHASIKRIHYQTGKFALGSILCAVIPKDKSKLNAEYLYHFLDLNREDELVARMRGMANVTLPMKEIAKIEIPLPNLDDQKAFVKMYKSLGNKSYDLSFELTHQLDLVKRLRLQLLQDAIQGKLVAQNPEDEPASILLQKIKAEKEQLIKDKKLKKEKELPKIKEEEVPFEIPDNWVWCRLGQVCQKIHYGLNASAKPNKKDVRLLRITDIQNNKVDWDSVPGCDFVKSDLENYLLSKNDIVIARTGGTIGKTFLVKELSVKSLFASYLIRAIPSKNISPEYLKAFLESPFYWNQLYSAAWGAQLNVNGTSLSNLVLPLPPIKEQDQIIQKLDQLMQTCDALEASIKQSQQKNEQLLQQVLREALTKDVSVEAKEDEKYKSLLLAAEIIWQLNQKPTLGHIKLQKLVYLSNRTLQMNLPVNFLKRAMGPYDQELQEYIDKELAARQWFSYNEEEPLKYRPLQNAGGHKADFDKYFGEHATGINHLVHLFEDARSSTLEIVATLYWCWDEMLTGRQLVNDTALLAKFYAFSDKKKKHTQDNVIKALRWMEVQGIVPN